MAVCLFSGCTSLKAVKGKAAFNAMQSVVEKAEEKTAPSVVYVKLKELNNKDDSRNIPMGAMSFGQGSPSYKSLQGIVLSAKGHILIPEEVKPDEAGRIEVLVGDAEYPARIVKVDDKLKMTIIKVDAEEELMPLDIEDNSDLEAGEWCVIVEASDEEREFEVFSTLSVCTGEIADRYRQFVLNNMVLKANGAPVVSVDGKVAGLIQGRNVLAMSDLCEDLKEFLSDATEVVSAEEEEEKGKSWLGVMLEPVNREYAKAHDLPKSGLWVVNVPADGPAAEAGIRSGDMITGFNGKPLRLSGKRTHDYFIKTMRPKIGKAFEITVLRDGKEKVCSGVFTKKPEEETIRAEDIGVTVQKITDTDYFINNLFTKEGVIITDILKGSPAATSSSFGRTLLSQNDVIVSMAGKPTLTLDDFSKALEFIRNEKLKVIEVTYWRGRSTGYAGLNLEKNENGKGGKQ